MGFQCLKDRWILIWGHNSATCIPEMDYYGDMKINGHQHYVVTIIWCKPSPIQLGYLLMIKYNNNDRYGY